MVKHIKMAFCWPGVLNLLGVFLYNVTCMELTVFREFV